MTIEAKNITVNLDGKKVLDNQSALFKSGHQINTPANVSLKSLDRVYKKR